MNQPKLQAVADSENAGAIDAWILPADLPVSTGIIPCRFRGPRIWKFDPTVIILLPMPSLKVEDTARDFASFPVLTHNHRKWMLENQDSIPSEYQAYNIYFPSDVYIQTEAGKSESRFIYRLLFKENKWIEEQVHFGTIPPAGSGRIIMMR